MISFCPKCKPHAYQDKKLGKNMRYVNDTTKGTGENKIYRCTVCRNEDKVQRKPIDWDLVNK